jgi:hypothetical protein
MQPESTDCRRRVVQERRRPAADHHRFGRISHVQHGQDEIAAIDGHLGRKSARAADPEQPVHTESRDAQKPDLDGLRRNRHVVDAHPADELILVRRLVIQLRSEILGFVLVLGGARHVGFARNEQNPVVELQVQRSRTWHRWLVRNHLR